MTTYYLTILMGNVSSLTDKIDVYTRSLSNYPLDQVVMHTEGKDV